MSSNMFSIVECIGLSENGRCGYCHQEEAKRASFGVAGHCLSCEHFNQLLDRGWSRSGKYLYKPIIAKACCPQYTIRLDANKFCLSKTQKRVLRRMNDFIQKDIRPKQNLQSAKNACSGKKLNEIEKRSSSKKMEQHNIDETKTSNNKQRERGQKKKLLRRERAFKKLREKGISIEEAQKLRQKKEECRRRTLESFILNYDPETSKHKLEVRMVALGSSEFEATLNESFALYQKYQLKVHSDNDNTLRSYKNFLANSPLFSDEDNNEMEVRLGSYHQQYFLDDHLIAVGVVDILPRCLSAKYLYYDPEYEFLTLGTYTALREIAYTQMLSKKRPELHYYYMGYFIYSCQKMRYKGRFHPSELLCDRSFTWVPLQECIEMMEKYGERLEAFAKDAPKAESCPVETVGCLYKMNALSYRLLLALPDFKEKESFMEEYAQIAGPVAREMLLYRS